MIKNNVINYLFVCLLLIFGILNPTNIPGYLFSTFLFSVFATITIRKFLREEQSKSKKKLLVLIYFFSVLFIIYVFAFKKQEITATLIGLVLGLLASFLNKYLEDYKLLIIATLLVFLITAIINGDKVRRLISIEPQAKTYLNDQLSFLRVAYLVESGSDYYAANEKAITEDGRIFTIPLEIWGWRLPTYSYVWAYLPGNVGISAYWLFILLASCFIYISFQIAKIFIQPSLAVLSSYILFPYMHFAARDVAFLEIEWWGLIFFTFGLYFLLKKRYSISSVFFFVALIFREIFMIPILGILFLLALSRDWRVFSKISFCLIAFFLFWVFHYLQASKFIGLGMSTLVPRDHPWGTFLLMQTLSYASWEYLMVNTRPFVISIITTTIFAAGAFVKKNLSLPLLIIGFAPLCMALAILKIGTPPYDDYWGISYVPLVLITLPVFIFNGFKFKQPRSA